MAKIRACHERLLLLSRIFVMVMDSVHTAKMRCTASELSLVAEPSVQWDYNDALKPAARRSLEKVPYPACPYLPLWDEGRMGWLRWGINILFSSTGAAWSLSRGSQAIAALLSPAVFVYMLTAGVVKQASYATGVRANMDIGLIKFGSQVLNNPFVRRVMLALMPVRVHTRLTLFSVPAYIFTRELHKGSLEPQMTPPPLPPHLQYLVPDSQQEMLPPTWGDLKAGPPVVLYCHGGGFCVSLLTMDFQFIGAAVKASGAVFVVPEYGLAPECPFPGAIDHMEAYYRWIVHGGLGFSPSRIVLVGESAGGNIMTSLTLRLVKSGAAPMIRQPDALILGYPTLNMTLSTSPSRVLHMCDPMLANGILVVCVHSYVPEVYVSQADTPH